MKLSVRVFHFPQSEYQTSFSRLSFLSVDNAFRSPCSLLSNVGQDVIFKIRMLIHHWVLESYETMEPCSRGVRSSRKVIFFSIKLTLSGSQFSRSKALENESNVKNVSQTSPSDCSSSTSFINSSSL